ncbi:DUF4265 domain-containing protein [Streptomyces sp. NPDC005263]|uniref:DUF4265 domain-containing protein n=1 Tax=Streptomyces sp. NPDC005263 TaxID=3364711 RepID=UPI0036AF0BDA
MAMVDLAPFGFEDERERMWVRPLADGKFEICCIPFRVYGMALGDVVRLHEGRWVENVVASSGRLVFRVFFAEPRPPVTGGDSREALREAISVGGFIAEWSGDRHVAVDIPEGVDPSRLFSSVEQEVESGSAFWEWAHSEPFRNALAK